MACRHHHVLAGELADLGELDDLVRAGPACTAGAAGERPRSGGGGPGAGAGGAAQARRVPPRAAAARRVPARQRLAAPCSMWSSTSSRVMRPPGPVPVICGRVEAVLVDQPAHDRRQQPVVGRRRRRGRLGAEPAARRRAAPGRGAARRRGRLRGSGLPRARGAGSGCGVAGSGAGAGAGCRGGRCRSPAAGAVGAAGRRRPRRCTAPTSTVSPSGTLISVSTPATGDGTSVSTLSVDTSNSGSSARRPVADLLEPLGDRSLGDRLTELGHRDVGHAAVQAPSGQGDEQPSRRTAR